MRDNVLLNLIEARIEVLRALQRAPSERPVAVDLEALLLALELAIRLARGEGDDPR